MLIRVQTPDGQVRVEVEDGWTLADFKRTVEKACNVHTWDQEFSRDIAGRQKIPDDGRSLRSLNVTHGEQLYLNDLSKSVAVYSAPLSAGGHEVPAKRAPPAHVRMRPPAAAMQPQADALRETTSPPIDPLSAPSAAPASSDAQEVRRRERKMAPMAKSGAPRPMVAQSSNTASGTCRAEPQQTVQTQAQQDADWEMDM